jgi:Tfp pilus assembly protein PilF
MLPNYFIARYSNRKYNLFQVLQKPSSTDLTRANTLLQHDAWNAAAAQFREILNKEPTNSLAYLGLGWSLKELQEQELAEDNLLKALALSPRLRLARQLLAKLYDDQGRTSEAQQQRDLAKSQLR